ncbi:hypothetical protein VO63_04820 [Streptomyces showdoensis]|uniref:Uncharacterized protein n=1 Tax=Streptomyces showdoensis TaxID=68268 RepID=A0A2P2GTF7_STREW|nr:hypothetical protein VO63_04820 [Streptomyces showdoensis]
MVRRPIRMPSPRRADLPGPSGAVEIRQRRKPLAAYGRFRATESRTVACAAEGTVTRSGAHATKSHHSSAGFVAAQPPGAATVNP